MSRLIIRNGKVVSPTATYAADIIIEGEKIAGIVSPGIMNSDTGQEIDATGCFVLPGLVDPHTHIQLDTGIYRTADNWDIGTKVAAFGGVTTVIDFATQFPGQSFTEALENRLHECRPAHIDYGLHMMITTPPADPATYRAELSALRDTGVPSIKLYTTYRPNYYMDDGALLHTFRAMPEDMIAMVHCENDAIVARATHELVEAGHTGWRYHGMSRPPEAEAEAIHRVLRLARFAHRAVYFVHCTTTKSIYPEYNDIILNALRGSSVFFETCPQYCLLNEDRYAGIHPEYFILQPPLRSQGNMLHLRNSAADTTIDVIATDHCDYTLSQKSEFQDFTRTPGGLPGLETSLALTYTYIVNPFGDLSPEQTMQIIATKMSATPAKIFGLYPRKGALLPGSDADLVIYDPKPQSEIRATTLHTVGIYTPYEGMSITGKVKTTISRGRILVNDGQFFGEVGRGQFLKANPFTPLI